MTILDDWIAKDTATLYATESKTVTFRKITSLSGPNPAINPVSGSITVQTTAAIGATSITLTAPTGNWFIEIGDRFTVAGNATVYTVTARNTAASSKFTGVTFTPALVAQATAGASVTFTWLNDKTVKSIVDRYPANLIDGTTITARDLRVWLQSVDTSGTAISAPTPVDRIIIDSQSRSIGIVSPIYAGSAISCYDVQAKG